MKRKSKQQYTACVCSLPDKRYLHQQQECFEKRKAFFVLALNPMSVCLSVCLSVCVRGCQYIHAHTHTLTRTGGMCICTYIYIETFEIPFYRSAGIWIIFKLTRNNSKQLSCILLIMHTGTINFQTHNEFHEWRLVCILMKYVAQREYITRESSVILCYPSSISHLPLFAYVMRAEKKETNERTNDWEKENNVKATTTGRARDNSELLWCSFISRIFTFTVYFLSSRGILCSSIGSCLPFCLFFARQECQMIFASLCIRMREKKMKNNKLPKQQRPRVFA